MHDDQTLFHAGERALQAEAGVAERMARIGRQMISDQMPEQHRRFFPLLPFIIAGSVDARGQPIASLIAGPPGFCSSADPSSLRIDAWPHPDDPLHQHVQPGAALGLLGIQAHTRRRNRANGRVLDRDDSGFSLRIEQSFGNCPKYIQPREARYDGVGAQQPALVRDALGDPERALISRADTLFLASAHPAAVGTSARAQGVDVSHRGGPPGFAHWMEDDTFIIPDFHGNNLFNTLGNLRLNHAAGLLFIDVTSGDLLQVEAQSSFGAGAHPLAGPDFNGRVVRFVVQRARLFRAASRLRFRDVESAAER